MGGIPGYQPTSPLSPWLNLYQKQGGPVDNYHMFVQPELQLRNTLQAQQMGILGNSALVNAVGNRIIGQWEATNAAPAPTGAAATFLNQGAYFNNFRGTGFGATGAAGAGRAAPPPVNTGNTGGYGGGSGSLPIPGGTGGIGRGIL